MLPEILLDEVAGECKSKTPTRIIAVIAEHRSISREALEKISEEGTVVRTLKGDVIPHPAIRIHAEATKSEAALLKEWARLNH